jgi:hypothetical protein
MQRDLNAVVDWSLKNRLAFNVPKCKIMTYSRSSKPILFEYTMRETTLARVTEMKDLGILFQDNLTFRKHILEITNRAFKMLGFVLRTARHFNRGQTLRVLYDSLVRPIIESGSVIWGPNEKLYILKLEQIQKRFLRRLYYLEYGIYPYLFPSLFVMGCLGYNTLERRRKDYVCRHFFKLLRGIIHNPEILSRINLYVPENYTRSRSHHLFYIPKGKTNLLADLPTTRAVRYFNDLAPSVDMFDISYAEFVKFIDMYI